MAFCVSIGLRRFHGEFLWRIVGIEMVLGLVLRIIDPSTENSVQTTRVEHYKGL